MSLQAIAAAMTAIEEDTELTQLIEHDAHHEAARFRQQVQRVRRAAMTLPTSEGTVRDELRTLEQLCDGRLEEWRLAVRRARKLLGD